MRGITPEDYFAFEFASDPNISPDGKLVAYVVTRIDRTQNRRNSSIWMLSIDQSRAPWQFTTGPQSSTSPRWSPDGKWLAFLRQTFCGVDTGVVDLCTTAGAGRRKRDN
jgi:dipeptidyl aminopeptidase/acylaminoacyl peptidase